MSHFEQPTDRGAVSPEGTEALLRAQLQQMIDLLPQLVVARDDDGRILFANKALAQAYDTTVESLVGSRQADWHRDTEELAQMLAKDRALAGHDSDTSDETFTDAAGVLRQLRTVRTSCRLHPGRVLAISTDITAMRRFQLAQRVAGLGYWDWDVIRNTLCWSDEIYRIFGLTPQSFGASYDAFLNAVHPEDRAAVTAAVTAALESGQPYEIDHRIVLPGGVVRIVHERGEVERDAAGHAVRMLGTVQDITEQKRAEEALAAVASISQPEASVTFLRSMMGQLRQVYGTRYAFVGVFADESRRRIRTLAVVDGDAVVNNFEYDLEGTPCADILDLKAEFIPCNVAALYPSDALLWELGVESYFGAPLVDSRGTLRGLVTVMDTRPMQASSWLQPVLGVFAARIALELERQEHLAEIRRTERFLDNIVEHLPLMLFVKEAKGLRFIRLNQAGEQLLGMDRCELFGKNDHDLFPAQEADFFTGTDRQALSSGTPQDIPHETIQTRYQGERVLHTRKIPLLNEQGEAEYLLGISEDITERDRNETLLRETLALQRAILDSANSTIISTDIDGGIRTFNAGAEKILGYRAEEVVGKATPLLIHDAEEVAVRAAELTRELGQTIAPGFEVFVAKARQGRVEEREWTYVRKDGSRFPVLLSVTAMRDATGTIQGFLGIGRDLSERKRTDEELQLAASVFDHSLEGIMISDASARILRVNQAFTDITGYSKEEAVGKTPRLLRSDRHPESFYDALWHSIHTTGMWQGEIWNRRKSGEVYPEWRSIIAIRNGHGETLRYISIFTDITEKKLSEERIYRLAHYDVITGLPNRALFTERLEQALAQAVRRQRKLAVLFLDLDGFKLVNDTLGHPMGDRLLQQVAERLRGCVREGDTVARIGGDEFTVLLTELSHREDAVAVAAKMLDSIAKPYVLDVHEALISTSIGIAVYPGDGTSAAMLIKNADAALYQAKEVGKNTHRFFTAEMNQRAADQLTLRNEMRLALEREEFLLHYQPQVNLADGRIIGFEALARWQRHDGEMISPARFIPVAEESGLIVPLGYWVLRTACRQIKAWHTTGFPDLRMAVNLSRRQFNDPALIDTLRQILAEVGLAPHHLELEITETFLMQNAEAAAETLRQLHALGIEISIDDFGIAYSSLNQLKHFPIDRLKVDQSFVRDIPHDKDDMAITTAIIAMAHSLNLKVIAEGVETTEQLDFLRGQGCDEMQGYYFSRPLPHGECLELLRQGKSLQP